MKTRYPKVIFGVLGAVVLTAAVVLSGCGPSSTELQIMQQNQTIQDQLQQQAETNARIEQQLHDVYNKQQVQPPVVVVPAPPPIVVRPVPAPRFYFPWHAPFPVSPYFHFPWQRHPIAPHGPHGPYGP